MAGFLAMAWLRSPSSLDHIGPFARTVEDSRHRAAQRWLGRDEQDSTSAFAPIDDYRARS